MPPRKNVECGLPFFFFFFFWWEGDLPGRVGLIGWFRSPDVGNSAGNQLASPPTGCRSKINLLADGAYRLVASRHLLPINLWGLIILETFGGKEKLDVDQVTAPLQASGSGYSSYVT